MCIEAGNVRSKLGNASKEVRAQPTKTWILINNGDPDLAGMENGSLSSGYLRKRGLIDRTRERNYISR
jgi:hypothetical protein